MRRAFIAYDKLSKRAKRALDGQKRGTWGSVSPVTRRARDESKYDRTKQKARLKNAVREQQTNPPENHPGGFICIDALCC